jgi:hypothetical protein
MRKSIVMIMAVALVAAAAALSTPAAAADVKAVLDACDRTAGCDYHQNKDGSIGGCSANANPPVCFNCPADGKKQCHQTAIKVPKGGKTATGAVDHVKSVLAGTSGKPPGAPTVGAVPPTGILGSDPALPGQGPSRSGTGSGKPGGR